MRHPISMVVLLLSAFVAFASAQDLIVDVNLRMIDVFVEDQDGNTGFDLTAEDFEVIENGRVMALRHFSHESEPITIGLVVDRSSSIGPVRKKMDKAVTQLLQTVRPDDELLL